MHNGAAPTDRGDGIGAHVRATMADLAESGRLTPEIVAELARAQYCKERFNLGYAFLKPVSPGANVASQRHDHRGNARYWRQPLNIDGSEFLMCQEWRERGNERPWINRCTISGSGARRTSSFLPDGQLPSFSHAPGGASCRLLGDARHLLHRSAD